MNRIILFLFTNFILLSMNAQTGALSGRVRSDGKEIPSATVKIEKLKRTIIADSTGFFHLQGLPPGTHSLEISSTGYITSRSRVAVSVNQHKEVNIELLADNNYLEEIVITGTMKQVLRDDSPVPVEIYKNSYFKKNPTPCLFEAVGMINGVRPQLNCNVCNTGDIHINGMEGAYTMILIDGMPIVSGLSSVYGLSGIPNSIVDRIEVVKGPASSLYGSEAMGGIINVITKSPDKAPAFSADVFATSWQEYNTDVSAKVSIGKLQTLLGVNYFNYQQPKDKNKDGFTDVTLQNRVSVFNKWSLQRKDNRLASLAARYVYENRWGGQMNWNKKWRGSDSIYGESIYTNRWEVIGMYQLPVQEKIMLQFSYNRHLQDSYYGTTPYMADQRVAFGQLYWDKPLGKKHNLLLGAAMRYTWLDDNTPATLSPDGKTNKPSTSPLPGLFIQDEWHLSDKQTLLLGYRFDYDRYHGAINSPRMAYKFSPNSNHTLRASMGTGFRVVNLFTEDHAALTGARQVVITEELEPERSVNANLNYVWKIPSENSFLLFDVTGFYSYFSNKITGDFDTDPNKIIYSNLDGYAISRGISLNTELSFRYPLKMQVGVTYQDVFQKQDGSKDKIVQLHAPNWSGTYLVSYDWKKVAMIDLTGTFTGPMRLPIQPEDYRPEYSPWFSITNIQLTRKLGHGWQVYGGVKNLLNFIPAYTFMRPFDPFDKYADDPVSNPHGYTFDTEYNYAPIQGIRGFLGVRCEL